MKYLFILGLLALVAFYCYWRLRPYIRGVRRMLGVVREVNRVRAAAQTDLPRAGARRGAAGERLVRCASCGTWAPASRAVSLRTGSTYCSHACMERAADPARHARRKSAS